MSNVSQWSVTAGNNNASPPDGWPEGMAPSDVNNSARENMAALARWYGDLKGNIQSGGSASSYTLTTNNGYAALTDISILVFRAHATNNSGATLNVDGLGSRPLRIAGAVIESAAIVQDTITMVAYNALNDVFDVLGRGINEFEIETELLADWDVLLPPEFYRTAGTANLPPEFDTSVGLGINLNTSTINARLHITTSNGNLNEGAFIQVSQGGVEDTARRIAFTNFANTWDVDQTFANANFTGNVTIDGNLVIGGDVNVDISTDGSLFGTGNTGDPLGVDRIILGETLTDNSGDLTIDIGVSPYLQTESIINITGGAGSDFTLTIGNPSFAGIQGKKIHIFNESAATVTVALGANINWMSSPVGSSFTIPPNSGLITFMVALDFVQAIGLAFQGGVQLPA